MASNFTTKEENTLGGNARGEMMGRARGSVKGELGKKNY